MTQAEFERELQEALIEKGFDLARADVREFLETEAEVLGAALHNGESQVVIRGLGRWKLGIRPATKAKMGRNPATGEDIKISAKPARLKMNVLPDLSLRRGLGVGEKATPKVKRLLGV